MSSSPLNNFNPNGDYPFMNHTKSALPIPPSPSQYPQGVPSANYYSQKPPSPPGTQPPSPLAAPMPQYPPQMDSSYSTSSVSSASSSPPGSGSGGIFTLYKPDGRRTPDLPDILSTKKKPTWNQK